jgi:NSS family neurotransmitter:Na+ symporter
VILGVLSMIEATIVACDGLGANGFPQILGQGCWLDSFDLVSEGLMMPLGAFLTSIVFGWIMPNYIDDEIEQCGFKFTMKPFWTFCMKFIVPVMMFLVLLGQISGFFGLGWFE